MVKYELQKIRPERCNDKRSSFNKGAISSDPEAFLLFKQFNSLKVSLTAWGIRAIVDDTFLDLYKKVGKF